MKKTIVLLFTVLLLAGCTGAGKDIASEASSAETISKAEVKENICIIRIDGTEFDASEALEEGEDISFSKEKLLSLLPKKTSEEELELLFSEKETVSADDIPLLMGYRDVHDNTIKILEGKTVIEYKITRASSGYLNKDLSGMKAFDGGEKKELLSVCGPASVIVFERDDCPDCKHYIPSIIEALDREGVAYIRIQVLKKPEGQKGTVVSSETVKEIGLTQVPSVIMIEGGAATKYIEHPGFTVSGSEISWILDK